jgi:hypothetical protein
MFPKSGFRFSDKIRLWQKELAELLNTDGREKSRPFALGAPPLRDVMTVGSFMRHNDRI